MKFRRTMLVYFVMFFICWFFDNFNAQYAGLRELK